MSRRSLVSLACLVSLVAPAATAAPFPGEILASAAVEVPSDVFSCGTGDTPCDLRVRTYSALDPSDFFGSANPVDGYPRYNTTRRRYLADPQLTGNYPASGQVLGQAWFSIWDGVTNPETFDHVGYYGAQSQVVNFGELGNSTSVTCLPVVSQQACFLALASLRSHDIDGYGPAGRAVRAGGLAPIPRPTPVSVTSSSVQFTWEEAAAATANDDAPFPIEGYELLLAVRDRFDRVGPSAVELALLDSGSALLDPTPGTFIPYGTTEFELAASDPVLAGFDPATQSIVAVLRLVYVGGVTSSAFSANSYPAVLGSPTALVTTFAGRFVVDRVVLDWSMNGLAGLQGFNVLRSTREGGPYYPVLSEDIAVEGISSSFTVTDRLDARGTPRTPSGRMFYRLEITGLDGARTLVEPIAVDVSGFRRSPAQR